MISLTRLDGARFWLNAALIVTLEEAPDTVVVLSTGTSMMVREKAAQILDRILQHQRSIRGVVTPPQPE
ncbi:MAG: flagellar FlbD family protein [Deltaproteobacteria bacterium]|nr:flagellar FlbD family protein [Deltaproteobacteria bacterium]